jgi:two-component system sensor histidine kinase/response regulator
MAQKRILLIDDDQISLKVLQQALLQAGYEVMIASDGRQGLEKALSESPDLILLDLLLPGLDGYEICARLKEDPHYASIPIVMLTGVFITPEDMQRGLQLGAERFLIKADAYIAKPPVYEQLLREVRVLLGEEGPPTSSEKELILIVDDDALICQLLKETLTSEGYSVVTAKDGQEGWARFQSSSPDLVLLDVQMPGLDGLEVLQRIREQTAEVAVVIITAYGSEALSVKAMKQGADDYITKPFQPWQIVSAVQDNLEKARLRRLSRQLTARLRDSNVRLIEKHRALEAQNATLQKALQRLQEAEQTQRNMVSMIVHDLKNPLNVVFISIDLLASDFGGMLTDDQREILRNANLAGQQMLRLITNLLEVQRLEDGKMPVRLELLDLTQVLKLMVGQAQPLADQKDITLSLTAKEPLPFVTADVDLTSRVVANLLDNAIKFTPLNGQIAVVAELKDGEIVVSVADNGPGIPANQQASIFEAFVQVPQDIRGEASVGLGLAFCRLAIDALAGRIWVESELGEGAKFSFALPANPEDSSGAE